MKNFSLWIRLVCAILAAFAATALCASCGGAAADDEMRFLESEYSLSFPETDGVLFNKSEVYRDTRLILSVYRTKDGGRLGYDKQLEASDSRGFSPRAYMEKLCSSKEISLPDELKPNMNAFDENVDWFARLTWSDNRFRDHVVFFDAPEQILYVVLDVHQV